MALTEEGKELSEESAQESVLSCRVPGTLEKEKGVPPCGEEGKMGGDGWGG